MFILGIFAKIFHFMLLGYPTKSGTGISLMGDYDDLNTLYSVIHHYADVLDPENEHHKAKYNLLMNFAYEVRKASYGSRLIEATNTESPGVPVQLIGCQFVWTDILIFISVLRYCAGYQVSDKLHQAILHLLEYNVEQALFAYDPEGANVIKHFIGQRININDKYAFNIYQKLHVQYVLEKNGKTRFRKIPGMLSDYFCDHSSAYKFYIAELETCAKEQNCKATDLEMEHFPDIVW